MSKRNKYWNKIFENSCQSEELKKWLFDRKQTSFQLENDVFKELKIDPNKMIPTYSKKELPEVLQKYGLNLLRNKTGGCLLIKINDFNLPTLFPKLNEPNDCTRGPPYNAIPKLELFNSKRLINEETGIYLAWHIGVIDDFLKEIFNSEDFFFGGRLRTKVDSKIKIVNETHKINASFECDAYFESDNNVVILECKKAYREFADSFSLHQILLPYILLKKEIKKSVSCIYFDFILNPLKEQDSIIFRLFHYKFENDSIINPFSYKLSKSKKYIIDFHKTIDSY